MAMTANTQGDARRRLLKLLNRDDGITRDDAVEIIGPKVGGYDVADDAFADLVRRGEIYETDAGLWVRTPERDL